MSRIDFLRKTAEINLDHFLERSVGTKPALEDQSFRLTYRVHDNNIDVIIIGLQRERFPGRGKRVRLAMAKKANR